jgi:antitoxin VapB
MALNIKNAAVERLASDVAALTGETKTEAIRKSLEERKLRLSQAPAAAKPRGDLRAFLEREIWPLVPQAERGKRLTREEADEMLGYGPDGV